jgi:hypothetical protein
MSDEVVGRGPSSTPAARGPRYKRHELDLADGGRLVLGVDGTIDHHDADGARTQSWTPGDPEWPDKAIRFGIRPQADTVAPHGRRDQGTRPPHG